MTKIVCALIMLLSTQSLCAEEVRDPTTAKVEARIANAKTEINSLGAHPWAGEYFAGDGLGMNLRLWVTPRIGAVFQWHGCMGLYEQNFGTIDSDGPYLSVDWEIENDDPYVTNTRYIVVPFGNSVFLVPDRDIHRFFFWRHVVFLRCP